MTHIEDMPSNTGSSYHSLARSTRIVVLLLALAIAANLAVSGYALLQFVNMSIAEQSLRGPRRSPYASAPPLVDLGSPSIGIWILFANQFIAAVLGFAFLGWVYSAHRNLPALRVSNATSPLLAVLCVLIPVVNFVSGFFVLKQLWRQSDLATLPDGPPSRRKSLSPIVWWWVTLALSIALQGWCLWMIYSGERELRSNVQLVTVIQLIIGILGALSALLAIIALKEVSAMQERRMGWIRRNVVD